MNFKFEVLVKRRWNIVPCRVWQLFLPNFFFAYLLAECHKKVATIVLSIIYPLLGVPQNVQNVKKTKITAPYCTVYTTAVADHNEGYLNMKFSPPPPNIYGIFGGLFQYSLFMGFTAPPPPPPTSAGKHSENPVHSQSMLNFRFKGAQVWDFLPIFFYINKSYMGRWLEDWRKKKIFEDHGRYSPFCFF